MSSILSSPQGEWEGAFHERAWYQSKFCIVDDGHKSEGVPLFKKKHKPKMQEVKVSVEPKSDT